MVIDNLNIVRIPVLPYETDAPLLIDPDAVLSNSVPLKSFKFIPWGNSQVLKDSGPVQIQKPSPCLILDSLKAQYLPVVEKGLRLLALECFYHWLCLLHCIT